MDARPQAFIPTVWFVSPSGCTTRVASRSRFVLYILRRKALFLDLPTKDRFARQWRVRALFPRGGEPATHRVFADSKNRSFARGARPVMASGRFLRGPFAKVVADSSPSEVLGRLERLTGESSWVSKVSEWFEWSVREKPTFGGAMQRVKARCGAKKASVRGWQPRA